MKDKTLDIDHVSVDADSNLGRLIAKIKSQNKNKAIDLMGHSDNGYVDSHSDTYYSDYYSDQKASSNSNRSDSGGGGFDDFMNSLGKFFLYILAIIAIMALFGAIFG